MIRRELAAFLIVGITTVVIDLLIYRATAWMGLHVDLAKAVGFLTGTVFAYLANRMVTFGDRQAAPGSLLRFVLLYAATLAANVGVNAALLRALHPHPHAVTAAFVVATGLSASLNFIGMKFFVFRPSFSPTRP